MDGPEPGVKVIYKAMILMMLASSAAEAGEWWNHKKERYEHHQSLPPEEAFQEYIPQLPEAQNLYKVCVALPAKTPVECMELVLRAVITRGGAATRAVILNQ